MPQTSAWDPEPRARPQHGVLAKLALGVGEVLITAGVLLLLFIAYLLWGTGIQTGWAQDDLRDELENSWSRAEPASPARGADLDVHLGDAYALIRIPRFGPDWEWVVVQGVDDESLENGPGHYPASADPGELGNFAVAGHRSGWGEPFAEFPELREGDIVDVETAHGSFRYELDDAPDGDDDGNLIEPDASWVVDPVPGEDPDAEPTERRITLTTCWPRWGSEQRMYATGVLVSRQAR